MGDDRRQARSNSRAPGAARIQRARDHRSARLRGIGAAGDDRVRSLRRGAKREIVLCLSALLSPTMKAFSIGSVRIDPPLALAPMAEVTDTHYRSLIKELGGAGLVVSEFISAEGLTRDNARTRQMLAFSEAERPVAIQIYGGDPDRMDDAAAIVEAEGVDIVDVNMGCPVRTVVNSGAGAALLKDFT